MTRPNQISLALVTLALYGDLTKRILPAGTALAVLYGAASLILLVMLANYGHNRIKVSSAIATPAGLLMLAYVLQLTTAFAVSASDAITAAAYICLPLAFLVVIPRVYPEFDLYGMALYVTILMVPINVVGLIQQYVNHSFFISTVYTGTVTGTGIVGGVIERNFLSGGGTFHRYPAIFVSADRYAGIAMMHVLFSVLLLGAPARNQRIRSWALASFASALVALFIAGARSRMLIVACALLAGALAFVLGMKQAKLRKTLVWSSAVVLLLLLAILASDSAPAIMAYVQEFPIVRMMEETFRNGDVTSRLGEGLALSLMPEDASLFGEGLGTVGGGRPGEFGIRVMWIESGLFWTPLVLAVNGVILVRLMGLAIRTVRAGRAVLAPLATAQVLGWIFALLAGLSSTFELSQALLMFPSIAVLTIRRRSVPLRLPTVPVEAKWRAA
jgi:hypothetical protein